MLLRLHSSSVDYAKEGRTYSKYCIIRLYCAYSSKLHFQNYTSTDMYMQTGCMGLVAMAANTERRMIPRNLIGRNRYIIPHINLPMI